ncbi:MAG: TonB-dependent siderophore receptor [Comamonadaceae bacterium]|nr:TonB-dependent siderophore receptor [Comamonadaceae bacterium]
MTLSPCGAASCVIERNPRIVSPADAFSGGIRAVSLAAPLACCALVAGGVLLPFAVHAQGTAATQHAQSDVSLPAVTVTADTAGPEELPGTFVGGQVAKGARLGALGNLDVMDTPFNVTSYTAELIENQAARTIGDVLTNDPGVRFTTSSGHAYENFRIRGFDVNQNDLAINGMYGLMPVGHTPVEMFERVEVLKGPSALFSGMSPSGAVGGTVNLVPKRADDEPLNRASLDFQSDSQLGVKLDMGRRFGEHKKWGLRVNGAFTDGDTELGGQSKQRQLVSAGLDYRGGPLKASLDAYYSKESYNGGIPAMFWMPSTVLPAPDASVNQFPAAQGVLESKAVVARAQYLFNANVSAFAGIGVRNHGFNGFINGTHVRSINAAGNSTNTVTVASRGYDDAVSSEAGVRLNFNTSTVAHEIVLQASHLALESGAASATSAFSTNIYNPVYHAMPATPATAPKSAENTLSSVALVDTMSFMADRLRLTLGARHQTVKTTNFNTATGTVTGAYDKSAVTPAAAVVFKPWGPNVSLYANYVQGLSKGDSISTPTYVRNHTFAPYKTQQKEIGVKWNAGTFTNTASLFEITKPMLVSVNGNDASDSGEKRVRGLEWNTFGEVARGVRLLGGAAYTQGVQTKTANSTYNGNASVGSPRWQGNLGMEWDTTPGLTLSSRIVANSSQYLNAANTLTLPGWGELEVGARYATKISGHKAVLRLNIANALNRRYYSGVFSDTTPIATLGQGRTVSASVTVDF